jgi:hypothetical protein
MNDTGRGLPLSPSIRLHRSAARHCMTRGLLIPWAQSPTIQTDQSEIFLDFTCKVTKYR